MAGFLVTDSGFDDSQFHSHQIQGETEKRGQQNLEVRICKFFVNLQK